MEGHFAGRVRERVETKVARKLRRVYPKMSGRPYIQVAREIVGLVREDIYREKVSGNIA